MSGIYKPAIYIKFYILYNLNHHTFPLSPARTPHIRREMRRLYPIHISKFQLPGFSAKCINQGVERIPLGLKNRMRSGPAGRGQW